MKTAVFLTCFIKYDTLEKIFEEVKKAKPPILFIASDGARDGNDDDKIKIKKCREIFENINWNCEVHRFYSNVNLGILENLHQNLQKAFQIVDELIFLEDDMLPSISFFQFCEEMLIRYKDDYRIQYVSGGNFLGKWENVNSDYFFARCVFSGANGLWKRSYEALDKRYEFVDDKYVNQLFLKSTEKNFCQPFYKNIVFERSRCINDDKFQSFEKCFRSDFFVQNTTAIFPKYNLVKNIGVAKDSEHNGDDLRLFPKRFRNLFELDFCEINSTYIHPKYVINDLKFEKIIQNKYALFSKYEKIKYIIERSLRQIRYKGAISASNKVLNRIKRHTRKVNDRNG